MIWCLCECCGTVGVDELPGSLTLGYGVYCSVCSSNQKRGYNWALSVVMSWHASIGRQNTKPLTDSVCNEIDPLIVAYDDPIETKLSMLTSNLQQVSEISPISPKSQCQTQTQTASTGATCSLHSCHFAIDGIQCSSCVCLDSTCLRGTHIIPVLFSHKKFFIRVSQIKHHYSAY